MARYNEILVGRFARAVQKLFGMKGEVPVGSLAGELQVIHPFLSGVENRYLEGWDRFGVNTESLAVAAQTSAVQFRNPPTSNAIAVLEKVYLNENVADNIVFRNGVTVDLTNIDTNRRLDSRGRPASSMLTSHANNPAVAGTAFWRHFLQANVPSDFILFEEQEIAILPGDGILLISSAVNVNLDVSWIWRERFLEESERT